MHPLQQNTTPMSDEKDYDAILASVLEENPSFRDELIRLETRIQVLTDILNGHIDIQDEEE